MARELVPESERLTLTSQLFGAKDGTGHELLKDRALRYQIDQDSLIEPPKQGC